MFRSDGYISAVEMISISSMAKRKNLSISKIPIGFPDIYLEEVLCLAQAMMRNRAEDTAED
jgi:hypothetical protein